MRGRRWRAQPHRRLRPGQAGEGRARSRAAEADRRTLIRRLSFDLIGLPPTPEEVEAFVDDPAADAYEKLVDRLLASPHYGERWARHWLDVVRFGESNGFERDQLRPNAWPYRDWVVAALNGDLPYDEFVRLQLAGDVLQPGDPDALEATGFLVAGASRHRACPSASSMKAAMRQDELEDVVGTVGPDVPRPDRQLRPLPRPQVRPDPPDRLLPPGGRPRRRPARRARPATPARQPPPSWQQAPARLEEIGRRSTRSKSRPADRSWPSAEGAARTVADARSRTWDFTAG